MGEISNMFERRVPLFTKGRILKNEMLEELRDFPRHVTDIYFRSYADGVISGLDLQVDQEYIMISPGIVKHQKQLLLLSEAIKVAYKANGDEQILKLHLEKAYQTEDFAGQRVTVLLEDGCHLADCEVELARFQLKEGAYLRSDYQSLSDFMTGYNTLNIVHQPYSGWEGQTIHPAILRYFARELCTYKTENPHDLHICYQVLNGERSMSKEALQYYFTMRLGDDVQLDGNVSIHQNLIKVLEKAKMERRRGQKASVVSRKMIVE